MLLSHRIQKNINVNENIGNCPMKKLLPSFLSITSIFFSLIPNIAFAYGSETPVGQGLSYIIEAMYGSTGMAIATIAIMGVGIACLGRAIEWKWLLCTIGGVGVIFGAGAIVNGIKMLVH